jgi:DUF2075 family protein
VIVYLSDKAGFLADVDTNKIDEIIHSAVRETLHRSVAESEITSWKNSMSYMHRVLADQRIPPNSGVAIEYNIPQTAKRIDVLVSGYDSRNQHSAVIVELKQWQKVNRTDKDAIVSTFVGHAERELSHPSYQAWTYAALLEDFNVSVSELPIQLHPCAYLHNCPDSSGVHHDFYSAHVERAPVFLRADAPKLRDFIADHIRRGDDGATVRRMQQSPVRPSKSLADSMGALLAGNTEFLMIDEQKLVYETVRDFVRRFVGTRQKGILIVNGGPGTGKSVVAINLLVEFIRSGINARYVTKNAAPRDVYQSKLTGQMTKTRFSNLFTSSGVFHECEGEEYDVLLVDEAHRLNRKSGMFQNKGENQVKEIIDAASVSVFFIDEAQRVHFRDIGSAGEIDFWGRGRAAHIERMELTSQFRCNGSNGYLAWIDDLLQIRETANRDLDGIDYEVAVTDSAVELRDRILSVDSACHKARLVAGYCWDWVSKSDPEQYDIILDHGRFRAKWNLATHGNLWILKPEAISEVGCVHTCQGLEIDYAGVIFGADLLVRNGVVQTDPGSRAKTDKSLSGYKNLANRNPAVAAKKADEIIRNTYRTLLTRAQKGCFLYSVDAETNEYLKSRAQRINK